MFISPFGDQVWPSCGVGIVLLFGSGAGCGGEAEGHNGFADATTTSTQTESRGSSGTETGSSSGSGSDGLPVPEPKYDVLGLADAPVFEGACGGGGMDAVPGTSFIWIANSPESTVSKIDTVTLVEVGRYLTRQDGAGDPSRTSVNLNGDVAVANRSGGLVKFHAFVDTCEDRNGDGVIQTSTGADDVLPWEDEECRAWFVPGAYTSQRPVAWTAGRWAEDQCRYVDTKVWTSGLSESTKSVSIEVLLVDGETGVVDRLETMTEEEALRQDGFIDAGMGLYGGAVDGNGDLWAVGLNGSFVHAFREKEGLELLMAPSVMHYGIAVTSDGRVWDCGGGGVYDSRTGEWLQVEASLPSIGGCMPDGDGTVWFGGDSTLLGVSVETLEVTDMLELPGYAHGVSVDFQGYVWGVGDVAYRVDRDSAEVDVVDGLNKPYTYSDMTGFALANAGGWTPAP